ncbi:MAG: hypothetical protein CW716_05380 [Candidatus Bathyarchaeum sp.]|nr:MAG: hypothetical protein CW716_05380 [Candidatus Bathyarchaeum sp.]
MNKKVNLVLICAVVVSMMIPLAFAAPKGDATRIKDGVLTYSAGHYLEGEPLTLGFDPYGYNYQGHMFKGSYANAYLGRDGYAPYTGDDESYLAETPEAATHWVWPYRNDYLMMKWNDAWLSNVDADGDGALDRHNGYDSYIGSGAWLTNHQSGEYEEDGEIIKWNYFVKIVAVPEDATLNAGVWYTNDGVEIGAEIWGAFAIIMEVVNDPGDGSHGAQYISPYSAGFGAYAP